METLSASSSLRWLERDLARYPRFRVWSEISSPMERVKLGIDPNSLQNGFEAVVNNPRMIW
jgi:hypothetical protein